MNQRHLDGCPRHVRAPRRNLSPKVRGGEIRHYGFSRRKNNKCRNPSHARAPRRNPSPLLGLVTSAFAHVPTDQHLIWSDLSDFSVSCSYVFITCWRRHLRFLKSLCYQYKMFAETSSPSAHPRRKQGFSIFSKTFCCVPSTAT